MNAEPLDDFHHVGLTVRDIARSFEFWTEIVGLSVWDQEAALDVRPSVEREGTVDAEVREFMTYSSPTFDTLTANPGSAIRYAMLQSRDGRLIFQLTEYVAGGQEGPKVSHNRIGGLHFSFFTDDVDGLWASLDARDDVVVLSEVVQITPSMRSFYVEDPDGVPVEFIQIVR
jgi:catechol 2,3-dioxygenase-like lactoylglutathione lyase family enzyme